MRLFPTEDKWLLESGYLKGLTIVRAFSMICPSCISSEYRIAQSFSKADAITKQSQNENWDFFFIWRALLMVISSTVTNLNASTNWSTTDIISSVLRSFFVKQTLINSLMTCELMKTLSLENMISFARGFSFSHHWWNKPECLCQWKLYLACIASLSKE